jgi:hypothetical protein
VKFAIELARHRLTTAGFARIPAATCSLGGRRAGRLPRPRRRAGQIDLAARGRRAGCARHAGYVATRARQRPAIRASAALDELRAAAAEATGG